MKVPTLSITASIVIQIAISSPKFTHGFISSSTTPSFTSRHAHKSKSTCLSSTSNQEQQSQSQPTEYITKLTQDIAKLKRVLNAEYTTFFDPMVKEYYSPTVTFNDPLNELEGIDSYQSNVDMLAGRTLMGKFLFSDAGIVLHKITGGEPSSDGTAIQDITTRWTMRLTANILPWKPTARFSGVSVYKLKPSPESPQGVIIVGQTDYWDSINIRPNSNGVYEPVDKSKAASYFLDQIKPGGFQAQSAGPELPYTLLRKGDGYEVRKYPAHAGVSLPYKRRDEGFGSLGAFARGMNPLSPALMEVREAEMSDKYMMWPLAFANPGEKTVVVPEDALEKAGEGQWRTVKLVSVPEKVVAIREFSDASMEPVVRKADRELREILERDGLVPDLESCDLVKFAQYDAIFSMGQRRGEVWIDLKDGGHPW